MKGRKGGREGGREGGEEREREIEIERARDKERERDVHMCLCVYIYVGLDFTEFQHNMKDVCANIHLTRDDFDIITENGKVRILQSPFCGSFVCQIHWSTDV